MLDDKYTNLVNWAYENGARQYKIEIKLLTTDNRYVVASEDIKVITINKGR
jgi:hypothetical protein